MLHYIQLKAEVREYGFGLWPRLTAAMMTVPLRRHMQHHESESYLYLFYLYSDGCLIVFSQHTFKNYKLQI